MDWSWELTGATLAIILAIGNVFVTKYRTDDHGTRIEKVETKTQEHALTLVRFEEMQATVIRDVGELKQGIKDLLLMASTQSEDTRQTKEDQKVMCSEQKHINGRIDKIVVFLEKKGAAFLNGASS